MNSDEGGKRQETESSADRTDDSDILQSFRIRRLIQNGVGYDKLLLAYNFYFLPIVSIVLWSIFLAIR